MPPKTTWIIGSDPASDLVIERPAVSWRHCSLTRLVDGTYLLEDLGSTNGTYVNGAPIQAATPVHLGDEITLGRTVSMPWPAERAADAADAVLPEVPPMSAPRIFSVGRDPDNDLVIDRVEVSTRHARVSIAAGGLEGVVEDLGSTNGTSLGTPGNVISRAAIAPHDVIFFGPVAVPAARFFPETSVERRDSIPEVVFQGRVMVVGRDASCDRVIDFPVVSSRHARLINSGGAFLVEDLGSSNGTFVNGKRVEKTASAKPGDLIGLGSYTFRLLDRGANALVANQESTALLIEPMTGLAIRHAPLTASTPAFPQSGRAVMIAGVVLGAQAGVVVGGVVFAAGRTSPSALFGLSLGAMWFGMTSALFERLLFSISRPTRGESSERQVAIDVALSLGRSAAINLVLVAVLIAVVAARLPFEGGRGAAFALLWLTSLVGSAISLALLRLTRRLVFGLAAVVVLTVVMALVAGPTRPLPRLNPVARATAAALPTRWTFEALLLTWAGRRADDPVIDPVEPFFPAGTDRAGIVACVWALLALLIGAIYANVFIGLARARPDLSRTMERRPGTGSATR